MTPKSIIIHHSATEDGDRASWPVIRKNHIDRGFDDIGYHIGIERLRGTYEILLGRMMDKQGAHCYGHNSGSIGVCFIGNFDLYAPSTLMWNKGVKIVTFLMNLYSIKVVVGHREYNNLTSCPGKMFNINKFKEDCEWLG